MILIVFIFFIYIHNLIFYKFESIKFHYSIL